MPSLSVKQALPVKLNLVVVSALRKESQVAAIVVNVILVTAVVSLVAIVVSLLVTAVVSLVAIVVSLLVTAVVSLVAIAVHVIVAILVIAVQTVLATAHVIAARQSLIAVNAKNIAKVNTFTREEASSLEGLRLSQSVWFTLVKHARSVKRSWKESGDSLGGFKQGVRLMSCLTF
ncbi:MAG: hypothetical protein JSR76_01150 [Verrucomicrobia bacterium]|nr:hypothetical protein [Verrucomicrobiota bacterium]